MTTKRDLNEGWLVRFREDPDHLELNLVDKSSLEAMLDLLECSSHAMKEHQCQFILGDLSAVTGWPDILDIYAIAKQASEKVKDVDVALISESGAPIGMLNFLSHAFSISSIRISFHPTREDALNYFRNLSANHRPSTVS